MQNMQTDIANHASCALLNSQKGRNPQNEFYSICNSKDLNECMTRKLMRGIKMETLRVIDSLTMRSRSVFINLIFFDVVVAQFFIEEGRSCKGRVDTM